MFKFLVNFASKSDAHAMFLTGVGIALMILIALS
jgi:hypothetical protein